MPATELLYLHDTYRDTAAAHLLGMRVGDDGRIALILDATIFYPQGGGQPADRGSISFDSGAYTVDDVRLDTETAEVLHWGRWQGPAAVVGSSCQLQIDMDWRSANARRHSAGHLLDIAMQTAAPAGLVPKKGYHFPEGPYVEYEGEWQPTEADAQVLEAEINHLVQQDIPMHTTLLTAEEAAEKGVWAPPGKGARYAAWAGHPGCGCGGTHVRSSGQLGQVRIRSISHKKNMVRIAYALADEL